MPNRRPFAVFDIDGTLIRWQLYHAMADALVKQGSIDNERYKSVLEARNNWKSRRSQNSFTEYERSLIRLIETAIVGIDYKTFKQVCAEVVNRYENQVYTYTRDLIASLRQQNYLIFAVSGSPEELVSLVANYYSFDDFAASSYEVKDNKLTGKSRILYGTSKVGQLTDMVKKYGATKHGSIGVGDTEGDIGLLAAVERPIAFNPSRGLFEWAMQGGWEVIVERKNVIYQLKYNDGTYILAPADQRQALI